MSWNIFKMSWFGYGFWLSKRGLFCSCWNMLHMMIEWREWYDTDWLASRVWRYPTEYDMWLIWTKFECIDFHEKGGCPKKAFEWKGSSLETVVADAGHMILYPTWEDNKIIGTSHMGGFPAVYSHGGYTGSKSWRLLGLEAWPPSTRGEFHIAVELKL